ncbi:hypothetical protein GCM10023184_29180 [Flaviaesturariibacter amylovorans]|uniref:Transcriptional regulator, AbiEi antitoxin, Type IV TA system n=1 Tax=Flaviaesturariibacter amylovorans TaxID=1084520 RepID=A0ABP8H6K5_9BACT
MLQLLKDYRRPNDKIHELLKRGELLQVKRGIYIPGPKVPVAQPAGVLLANHLRGPSYVSQETALAHWGLIPERVYEISSVTLKSAKSYKTPVGRFSYAHAALPYYAFGIRRVQLTPRQAVLMASPEKALCDKIILTSGVILRSVRQATDFLMEDLRIDEEQLRTLQHSEIHSWIPDAPKSSSLTMLLKTLEQL